MEADLSVVRAAQELLSSLSLEPPPSLFYAGGGNPTDAGCAVAHILADWGADDALQAAGVLHALACAPDDDAGSLDQAVADRCGQRTVHLLQSYRRFCLDSPLCVDPGGQPRTRRSQSGGGVGPGDSRRGDPLTLQRTLAYCQAYRDPDGAFLYAAVLWRRFELASAPQPPIPGEPVGSAIKPGMPSPQVGEPGGRPAGRTYAEEARLLLAPFLEMLGMRELRTAVDNWLSSLPASARRAREERQALIFQEAIARLENHLPEARFRLSPYTQTHNVYVSNITHLPTTPPPATIIDVQVVSEEACYQALYWVQRLFTPVEGGLADNIRIERTNGYRGLSATVLIALPAQRPDPKCKTENGDAAAPRERVQFRMVTGEMDEVNRWGLAALHLRGVGQGRTIATWWGARAAGLDRITSHPPGAYPETFQVFSPHGELFEFHRGCTVVDYAYRVHSLLADHCLRFYLNGEQVEPSAVLHHLDLVELEHDAHAPGPTQAWLDAARTPRARDKIRQFLNRHGRDIFQGQRVLDKAMANLERYYGFSIPEYRFRQATRDSIARRNLAGREDLLAEIAAGRMDAYGFLNRLFAREIVRRIELPSGMRLRPQQIHLAGCCRPRPGDDIVARVRRRGGSIVSLKVHRRDCLRLPKSDQQLDERLNLKWRLQPQLREVAQIEMTALDGNKLLGEAIQQVYAVIPRATLHQTTATARHGIAHISFTIEAEDREVLEQIRAGLSQLPDREVSQVRLMDLPPSEQERILSVGLQQNYNPYSRSPVRDKELFFGRRRELEIIAERLRAQEGNVWLRGQKRVGKTSLLYHLRDHYLNQNEFIPVYIDFQLQSTQDGAGIFYSVARTIYDDLRTSDNRFVNQIEEVGPPLTELFALDPAQALTRYVHTVQGRLGQRRLALLLDEFSRTIDAWERGRLDDDFFAQWRGVMINTPSVNCVTVIQERSYDHLAAIAPADKEGPIWELLELGEQLMLRPLDEEDVRRLIEWPIQNFLEYSPETVSRVARLTGGSPFLIHVFCAKLTTHMGRSRRRQVQPQDVEAVAAQFMGPGESAFQHLLDMAQGVGDTVVRQMAKMSDQGPVTTAQLGAALPDIDAAQLRRTLRRLDECDIIDQIEPERWSFSSQLFQQWLAANPAF